MLTWKFYVIMLGILSVSVIGIVYALPDGDITLKNSHVWLATKHSGQEAEIMFSYIHEQHSGRTQLCAVAQDGVPPGQLPQSLNVYDGNDNFLFSIDRELIDIEDSPVDGMWGFCRSVDYEIDGEYLRYGEGSIVFEWLEIDIVNYNLEWVDVNISLYIWDDPNSSVVDDIYVYELNDNWKFGANHTGTASGEINTYKYVVESSKFIEQMGFDSFIVRKNDSINCYADPFKDPICDDPKFLFNDVCENFVFNYTGSLPDYNCTFNDYERNKTDCEVIFNPECQFNFTDETNKTLEVLFKSIHDEELGFTPVDPTIHFSSNIVEAIDVAAVREDLFAIVWCDETEDDSTWAVYWTNGSLYDRAVGSYPKDITTSNGGCSSDYNVGVVAMNETEVVLSWRYWRSPNLNWNYQCANVHTGNAPYTRILDNGAGDSVDLASYNRTDWVAAWTSSSGTYRTRTFRCPSSTVSAEVNVGFGNNNEDGVAVSTFNETHYVVAIDASTGLWHNQTRIKYYRDNATNVTGMIQVQSNVYPVKAVASTALSQDEVVFAFHTDFPGPLSNPSYNAFVYYSNGTAKTDTIGIGGSNPDAAIELSAITDDKFIAAYFVDAAHNDLRYRIWDSNGNAFIDEMTSIDGLGAPMVSVAAKKNHPTEAICDGNIVIAGTLCHGSWNACGNINASWSTWRINGTEWDGICSDTCGYSSGDGDWSINCSESCIIYDYIDSLDEGANISIIGSGGVVFREVDLSNRNDLFIEGYNDTAKCEVGLYDSEW